MNHLKYGKKSSHKKDFFCIIENIEVKKEDEYDDRTKISCLCKENDEL